MQVVSIRCGVARRATYFLLGVLVFVLVLLAFSGVAWATTFSTPVDADYDHITNSAYLSQADFASGAPAAVVAGSESYGESLAATVLAKAVGGPLLLTSSSSLSTRVHDELIRLKVTQVFVVGLSSTIVNAVKATLPGLTADKIVSLAGTDSYQTAALVASKVKEIEGSTPARVFIVPGDQYGASVSAAAVAAANGWPILLTPQTGTFPAVSAQAITSLGVTTGVEVDTNVSPGVSGFTVEKTILGTTSTTDDPGARYSESATMADYAVQQGWATYANLGIGEEQGGSVAYSANFPDNILLASHTARHGGAYVLAKSTALQSAVVTLLQTHGSEIKSVDFMRPDYDQILSGAWSFGTIRQVKSLNSPRITGLSSTSGPLAGGGALTVTGSKFTGATNVRIGKTDLPAGSWTVNSDTSVTINAIPATTQQGAEEVFVSNYWNANPSSPSDVYFYLSASGPSLAGMKVVQEAIKYLGKPYVWAGSTPSTGFDCSGFTMYVYNQSQFTTLTGVTLPHHAADQATMGTAVSKDDLLPGDLVFFGSPVSHVGVYVGNGLMINSPRSGDLVTIEDAFRSNYVSARRFISAFTRVEDTSTLLGRTGSWTKGTISSASGGTSSYSDSAGASVTITFNGIYAQWITQKAKTYGQASVSVDGKVLGTVNLYSSTTVWKQKVWDTGVLPPGVHTVTVTRLGTSGGSGGGTNIGLDAFDVVGTASGSGSPPGPTTTRYQDTDSRVLWSGLWTNAATTLASGGCLRYINAAGGVSVSFNGTYLAWVGQKAPTYGIAHITVDGADAGTIDLYSAKASFIQTLWNTGTLASGAHTVSIEWTGSKNPSASASYIGADAFDIAGTPVAPAGLTRTEQTDTTHLIWAGSWETYSTAGPSGGTYKRASTTASVTVKFTGTYLSWVATAGTTLSKALVSLDGGPEKSVDLARSAVAYQQSVWATGVLASGPHTVTIRRDPADASGKFISIDAFDVIGTLN